MSLASGSLPGLAFFQSSFAACSCSGVTDFIFSFASRVASICPCVRAARVVRAGQQAMFPANWQPMLPPVMIPTLWCSVLNAALLWMSLNPSVPAYAPEPITAPFS
jgi:hypothetical protein